MASELEKWDDRWSRAGQWAGQEPCAFLVEALPWLPRGDALELAIGGGRNAVFLAARGWQVTGLDQSAAALAKTEELARQRGVAIAGGGPGIPKQPDARRGGSLRLVQADLESTTLEPESCHALLCVNFLLRRLAQEMIGALRPGGVLVYETYTLDQLKYEGGPRNPEYLLRPGELREMFPSLETLFYREVSAGKGIASLLAHRPA